MWGFVILLVLVALAVGLAALVGRHGGLAGALFARRVALTFVAVSVVLIGLFIIGETAADPGGWQAAGMIALWAAPLAGLSLLAWYRPAWAVPALALLLAGVVGLAIWFAIDPAAWRAFENSHGPVRDVVSFVLVLPAALAGWRRPLTGAVLLLILGLVPPVIAAAAAGGYGGGASLAAVSTPPVLGGLLYLLAVVLGWRATGHHPSLRHRHRPAHP